MRNPLHSPLGAVFHTEILFNAKRAAPYALMIVFAANAWLWWARGPAIPWGWATNSDFYIVRLLTGFTFMTVPLFIAVMMGDPVIRDFTVGIDPLIFSKPVSRFEYLIGKFLGNFFVLVCCQACFIITLLLLQGFSVPNMIVMPVRVLPYFKHFFFFLVVSSAFLAALCFTVGTLTRSVKIVYAMMTSFYVVVAAYQIAMKDLPLRWRILFDPLLMNVGDRYEGSSREWLNQLTVSYNGDMIANRVLVLLLTAVCLAILHARFSSAAFHTNQREHEFTSLDLSGSDAPPLGGAQVVAVIPPVREAAPKRGLALPNAAVVTEGARAKLEQLIAACGMELRLHYADRSLVVVLPLATLASLAGLGYYQVVPDPSYSAAYAGRAAESFLLFLVAIAIFYTGEALHRDRELNVQPLLWSVPAPNFVFLLSKFSTTLLLSMVAGLMVGGAAFALQLVRGHAPVEVLPYLTIYTVILVPSMAFAIAAAIALNVLLRDKYAAYAACLAVVGRLYFSYSLGHNHWLYNPVLYGLWTPSDLMSGSSRLPQIVGHRVYVLALTMICLAIAHRFFPRTTSAVQTRQKSRPTARRSSHRHTR